MERPEIHLGVDGFQYRMTRHGMPYVREDTRLGASMRLSAEGLVDRTALIRRVFADLDATTTWGLDAALALTELALTPSELAPVAGGRWPVNAPRSPSPCARGCSRTAHAPRPRRRSRSCTRSRSRRPRTHPPPGTMWRCSTCRRPWPPTPRRS
ncbi:hypothetical protein ACFV2H_06015 [Streptomyces sp. NPDC059629]|uniref:hypothetical protein n=1 Tax=Streptomyces sp. NPDC059629 TaxID=3346889 RepID=UPI0036B64CD0